VIGLGLPLLTLSSLLRDEVEMSQTNELDDVASIT
jgi:hypothetical protein